RRFPIALDLHAVATVCRGSDSAEREHGRQVERHLQRRSRRSCPTREHAGKRRQREWRSIRFFVKRSKLGPARVRNIRSMATSVTREPPYFRARLFLRNTQPELDDISRGVEALLAAAAFCTAGVKAPD